MEILCLTRRSDCHADEILLKTFSDTLPAEVHPAFICMAHTSRGLDAAPAIAASLDAACVTGVEKIASAPEGICFTRAVFSDKIRGQVVSESRTTVITIAPGAFSPEPSQEEHPGEMSYLTPPSITDAYEWRGEISAAEDTAALDQAEIIISAGNGVREKEDIRLIENLAELFPKSAVAGSRPICDKKWLPCNRQVGVTGATVAPKLYMACGISGASQHIMGMRDAKCIVAINTDPHAAIFNFSDICIIEDLTAFIPEFIAAAKDLRHPRTQS